MCAPFCNGVVSAKLIREVVADAGGYGRPILKRLRDDREVWLEGERVAGVTSHPELRPMAQTMAGIHDFKSFFSGDVVQLRMRRYARYDYSRVEESVRRFMGDVYGS